MRTSPRRGNNVFMVRSSLGLMPPWTSGAIRSRCQQQNCLPHMPSRSLETLVSKLMWPPGERSMQMINQRWRLGSRVKELRPGRINAFGRECPPASKTRQGALKSRQLRPSPPCELWDNIAMKCPCQAIDFRGPGPCKSDGRQQTRHLGEQAHP